MKLKDVPNGKPFRFADPTLREHVLMVLRCVDSNVAFQRSNFGIVVLNAENTSFEVGDMMDGTEVLDCEIELIESVTIK